MSGVNKKKLMLYLISIIVFQIVFIFCFFQCKDIILWKRSFVRTTSFQEWKWLIAQPAVKYEMFILIFASGMQKAITIIDIVGFCQLYWKKYAFLPIRLFWKIFLPVISFLAYLPCFYYFKYQAEHFLLYMDLVPTEFLTLTLLGLIIAGLCEQCKINSAAEN